MQGATCIAFWRSQRSSIVIARLPSRCSRALLAASPGTLVEQDKQAVHKSCARSRPPSN